jgi:hypothetical protein
VASLLPILGSSRALLKTCDSKMSAAGGQAKRFKFRNRSPSVSQAAAFSTAWRSTGGFRQAQEQVTAASESEVQHGLVIGVGLALELEGGVLEVEVTGQAFGESVQDLRSCALVPDLVSNDDVG